MSLRQLRKLEQHRRSLESPPDPTRDGDSPKCTDSGSNDAGSSGASRSVTTSCDTSMTRAGRSTFLMAANLTASSSSSSSTNNSDDEGPEVCSPCKKIEEPAKLAPKCGAVLGEEIKAHKSRHKSRHSEVKPRRKGKVAGGGMSHPTTGQPSETVVAREGSPGSGATSVAFTITPAFPEEPQEMGADTALASNCSIGAPTCLAMRRNMFDVEAAIRRTFGRGVVRESQSGASRSRGSFRPRQWWLMPPRQGISLVNPWMRMYADTERCVNNGGRKQESSTCHKSGSEFREFSLLFTDQYLRVNPTFLSIIRSHDFEALRDFVAANPGHPNALLSLSGAFTAAGRKEEAFNAIKEAVINMQTALHPKFSPFSYNPDGTPQVAVDSRNPFSRYLFCCLGLYMIGLGDQGCNSVALEVCKLLLAMDLSYDAFHALLHIDFYALRAKCYEFLDTFSREYVRQHFDYVADLDSLSVGGGTGTPTSESSQNQNNLALLKELKISLSVVTPVWDLRMSIPSFAFSSALASFFAVPGGSIKASSTAAIRNIQADDIIAVGLKIASLSRPRDPSHPSDRNDSEDCCILSHTSPSLLLMHALLLFPAALQSLLSKLEANGDSSYPDLTWDDILFAPPFFTATFPSHINIYNRSARRHGKLHSHLANCWAAKNCELWRSTRVVMWLHSAAAHLHTLCKNPEGCRLLHLYKWGWSHAPQILDLKRYEDSMVAEFTQAPTLPVSMRLLDEEANHLETNSRSLRTNQLSLRSSPIVLFFQTLLPWNEIDFTGLHARPVFISTFFQGIFSAFFNIFRATNS